MQYTYGGQALMAVAATVLPDRRVHSLNAYFLRGGAVDTAINYGIVRLRDGGAFSTRRVDARQGERHIFTMSTSLHALELGLEHCDHTPEGVPPPEKCPRLIDVMDACFG